MKKYFTFFIMCCLTLCSFSQTPSEHLKFMGIPIDGSLEHMTKEIMNKGFTFINKDDEASYLEGDFAGYSGCGVLVNTIVIKGRRAASSVSVFLPVRYSWALLYDDYNDIKEGLTKKYGTPVSNDPYEYFSYYKVGDAVILISVDIEEKNVILHYIDKIAEDDDDALDHMTHDL